MSDSLYLTLMLGAVFILVAILLPTMVFARCKACGAFNSLDAEECRRCHAPMKH